MPAHVIDLEQAGSRSVNVNTSRLQVKRCASPVVLTIVRANERIPLAAGELRSITINDCRPIGAVIVENDAGSGELELFWSELICLGDGQGKADAADGADQPLILGHEVQGTSGNTARLLLQGATLLSAHSPGTSAPATHAVNAHARHAATGRYGLVSRHTTAGTGAASLYHQLRGGNVTPRAVQPGAGHFRFTAYGVYLAFSGASAAAGGMLIERVSGLTWEQAATGAAFGGVGFVALAAHVWRAVFRNAAGAVVLDQPLGVSSNGAHDLELRAGVDAAGVPTIVWLIDGVELHRMTGTHAHSLPAAVSESSWLLGYYATFAAGAGFADMLVSAERGVRAAHYPEAL